MGPVDDEPDARKEPPCLASCKNGSIERYDGTPAREVMRGQRTWRRGLGRRMDRVDNVVVHLTAGWPRRARISVFTDRFTWTAAV